MKGIYRYSLDVDVILEKNYLGCKYKATTWLTQGYYHRRTRLNAM